MINLLSQGIDGLEQECCNELSGVRILAIMPSIPLQGMERANLQIMKMTRERGADVLFITERDHGKLIQDELDHMGCRWTAVSVITSIEERLHLTKNLRKMATVIRAWRRAARGIYKIYKEYSPTHIYITDLPFFLYSLPILLCTPQVVIFRLPSRPDTTLPPKKQRLYNCIWRYVVTPLSDLVICNSKYTLSQLKKVGVRPEKIRVIYNCVSERTPLEQGDAPKVNPGHFNVVYLGRIRPEKGVKELFEAALSIVRDRKDVDFYFAGEYHWNNSFAEGLMREVRERSLDRRIHFTGQIEDVFGLLGQCNIHVLPSTVSESFSNAVLEAKSQSVPSVVFPTGGLPEAVTHLVDGYICREKSAEELYKGIMYYLDNPIALKAAGIAARKSLERFSKEIIASQWAGIFKDIKER